MSGRTASQTAGSKDRTRGRTFSGRGCRARTSPDRDARPQGGPSDCGRGCPRCCIRGRDIRSRVRQSRGHPSRGRGARRDADEPSGRRRPPQARCGRRRPVGPVAFAGVAKKRHLVQIDGKLGTKHCDALLVFRDAAAPPLFVRFDRLGGRQVFCRPLSSARMRRNGCCARRDESRSTYEEYHARREAPQDSSALPKAFRARGPRPGAHALGQPFDAGEPLEGAVP